VSFFFSLFLFSYTVSAPVFRMNFFFFSFSFSVFYYGFDFFLLFFSFLYTDLLINIIKIYYFNYQKARSIMAPLKKESEI